MEVLVNNHNSHLTYLSDLDLRKEAFHLPQKLNNFVFFLFSKTKTFLFNAQSEEGRDRWLSALDKRIPWGKDNRVVHGMLKRYRENDSNVEINNNNNNAPGSPNINQNNNNNNVNNSLVSSGNFNVFVSRNDRNNNNNNNNNNIE